MINFCPIKERNIWSACLLDFFGQVLSYYISAVGLRQRFFAHNIRLLISVLHFISMLLFQFVKTSQRIMGRTIGLWNARYEFKPQFLTIFKNSSSLKDLCYYSKQNYYPRMMKFSSPTNHPMKKCNSEENFLFIYWPKSHNAGLRFVSASNTTFIRC